MVSKAMQMLMKILNPILVIINILFSLSAFLSILLVDYTSSQIFFKAITYGISYLTIGLFSIAILILIGVKNFKLKIIISIIAIILFIVTLVFSQDDGLMSMYLIPFYTFVAYILSYGIQQLVNNKK
ncbi:hypothetical protein DY120_01010 [Apilactobacillus micheneri]|uniref:Multipass membrane protein n=1 Tax=Apilactobacillus micheneri TaxID=1899430 RepID=A0ABY2Z304_9LACO|nr:hypothetical protein [Apilactobacillus micheneri]TPR26306.1 hypothetical protein DY114_01010 [Apilactobacillus micheneri]TPR27060.1 hypothetical protein DY111_01010 [Apilactobacillus micheneri]TPR27918.1 hypothetical protein DY113_04785 [Apilactobacillus micheneri]TPR31823.1 hypothetical protein DY117_01010 [Apilactobacillus micheneri]TPR32227.1 hypothetical protein DY120_01010 [Apilactobacillus micheneri]